MSTFMSDPSIIVYCVNDDQSFTPTCLNPLNITNGGLEVVLPEYCSDTLNVLALQLSELSTLRCFIVFRDLKNDNRFFCYYIFDNAKIRKRLSPYVNFLMHSSDGAYFIKSVFFCSKSHVMGRILDHLTNEDYVLEKKFQSSV